jgi:hypothetical protein
VKKKWRVERREERLLGDAVIGTAGKCGERGRSRSMRRGSVPMEDKDEVVAVKHEVQVAEVTTRSRMETR